MKTTDLSKPLQRYRSSVARGLAASNRARVERDGGDFGHGLIRGVAVITRGEALGHDMWVDTTMLRDVRDAINKTDGLGIKARFTHPDLSGDGLGSALGKFKDATLDGDVVRADLHFSGSAHATPDGDLASYVMSLAEEAPEDFGTSISFTRDLGAEEGFMAVHADETGEFDSPDELNVYDFPHARLYKLHAVDAVDEPAANPGGLFHRSPIAGEAEALAAYCLGLSKTVPALTQLNADPERVAGFVHRFLDRNNLTLQRKEDPVEDELPAVESAELNETEAVETVETEAVEPVPSDYVDVETGEPIPADDLDDYDTEDEELASERDPVRFVEAFGEVQGSIYFTRGLPFSAALEADHARLRAENERMAAAFDRGEDEPVSFESAETSAKPKGLGDAIRIRGKAAE